MVRVEESPVWLERQQHLREQRQRDTVSLARLFRGDLRRVTIHASLLMGALLALYQAITFWYPTLLGQMQRQPLSFLVAFNASAIAGNIIVGRLSETVIGRRGAATVATLVGVVFIPLYLFGSGSLHLLAGAMAMGFATGNFGMVPGYLSERFPTAARGAGAGFAYHVGAGLAAGMPYVVGSLQDRGILLGSAMAACIGGAALVSLVLLWLGPETRGRALGAADS
jgi:SHS family lactate transporter-like MFS transporter